MTPVLAYRSGARHARRDLPGLSAGLRALFAHVFLLLGVVAPLLLVAVVGLSSAEASVRAQRIVLGCRWLLLAQGAAVLIGLMVLLAVREAQWLAAPLNSAVPEGASGTA